MSEHFAVGAGVHRDSGCGAPSHDRLALNGGLCSADPAPSTFFSLFGGLRELATYPPFPWGPYYEARSQLSLVRVGRPTAPAKMERGALLPLYLKESLGA
jgi:hypothetical protein